MLFRALISQENLIEEEFQIIVPQRTSLNGQAAQLHLVLTAFREGIWR